MKFNQLMSATLGVIFAASIGLANAEPFNGASGADNQAVSPANGTQAGLGQHGGHGKHQGQRGEGMRKRHEEFMKQLNLTDDQKAKLKEAMKGFHEQNKATFDDLKSKREQLKALGKDGDKAQRKQLFESMKQERQALQQKRLAMMQQVLTPEQFAKMQQLHEQRKAEFEKRRAEWQQKREQHQNGAAPAAQ